MKTALQIFITITLFVFYAMPAKASVEQFLKSLLVANTVNNLITSSNKTEEIDCNKNVDLCSDIPSARNSPE